MWDTCQVSELERIRRLVAGTGLADCELQPVPVLDTGEVGYCFKVPIADAHRLWRKARELVDELGRWPVLVMEAFYPDTFNRFYYAGEGDQSPASVLERAAAMTDEQVWEVFLLSAPLGDAEWDGVVRGDLDESEERVGRRPELTVEDSRRLRPDYWRVEQALLEWEEQQQPTTSPVNAEYLDWMPLFDGPCGLMLMPTDKPWEVPAYTDFYGASKPLGHEALIRVQHYWWKRYGAVLMASWGTQLEFDVARPPADVHSAFPLALEQSAVAPCTIILPGVSVRQHARALPGRPTWYLHERP